MLAAAKPGRAVAAGEADAVALPGAGPGRGVPAGEDDADELPGAGAYFCHGFSVLPEADDEVDAVAEGFARVAAEVTAVLAGATAGAFTDAAETSLVASVALLPSVAAVAAATGKIDASPGSDP